MVSKLQELLAAKKGQANGQISSGQVVQSQASQQATAQPSAAPVQESKKSSILDRLKSKSVEQQPAGNAKPSNSVVEPRPVEGLKNVSQNEVNKPPTVDEIAAKELGQSDGQSVRTDAPKVEEIKPKEMPPGLTLMQQMKWKRENAPKPENVNAVAAAPNPQNSVGQKVQISPPSSAPVSQPVQAVSASQSADASKQNDGTVNVEELKNNLKYLSDNIENRDLVKNIVQTIALQIAQRPELRKHMLRGDVNLMVRGLRQAYQVAAMNKQQKAETKKKGDKDVDALAAAFKEMGVSFNFK